MRILAIETSCDETAISIVEFKGSRKKSSVKILSNIVSSQVKLHAKFGGVVPNLAKREHQKNLPPILTAALKEAKFLNSKSKFQKFAPSANSRALPVGSKDICFQPNKIPKVKIQKIEKILEREPELLKRFKKYVLPLKTPIIDAIAVTYGPGLAPALWVGVNFAKALACFWDKPIIPTNHMEGHLFSALLQKERKNFKSEFLISKQILNHKFQIKKIKFPAIALLVSGGHTELVLTKKFGEYKIIGETLDDAAGEAFDKVARLLGLGYPGGPEISAEAEKKLQIPKSKLQIKLPRPMINSKDYNFSFSGLKTAVLYLVQNLTKKYSIKKIRQAIAKEFQEAVVEVLVQKTLRAAKEYGAKTVLLGGGVAANRKLREDLAKTLAREIPSARCLLPGASFTGDNGLMIALAAYFNKNKTVKDFNSFYADANLRLSSFN